MDRSDLAALGVNLVVIAVVNLVWWLWLFPIYIRGAVQP